MHNKLTHQSLKLHEKKEIGKIIHDCTTYIHDCSIIFYLYKEKDFTTKRFTFPFQPDMEFLIVTSSDQ